MTFKTNTITNILARTLQNWNEWRGFNSRMETNSKAKASKEEEECDANDTKDAELEDSNEDNSTCQLFVKMDTQPKTSEDDKIKEEPSQSSADNEIVNTEIRTKETPRESKQSPTGAEKCAPTVPLANDIEEDKMDVDDTAQHTDIMPRSKQGATYKEKEEGPPPASNISADFRHRKTRSSSKIRKNNETSKQNQHNDKKKMCQSLGSCEEVDGFAPDLPKIEKRLGSLDQKEILRRIPEGIRADFGKLGFSKWKKDYLPVRQMNPFEMPSSGARDAWMEMFYNALQSKRPMRRLVFWCGTPENLMSRGYSLVLYDNFINYDQGCQGNHHVISQSIKKKLDNGKKLTNRESILVEGLKQINADAALGPAERSLGMFDEKQVAAKEEIVETSTGSAKSKKVLKKKENMSKEMMQSQTNDVKGKSRKRTFGEVQRGRNQAKKYKPLDDKIEPPSIVNPAAKNDCVVNHVHSQPTSVTDEGECRARFLTVSTGNVSVVYNINHTYAYINEDDPANMRIVKIVDKNTSHRELGQLMSIQKRRSFRKQSLLAMCEVVECLCNKQNSITIARRLGRRLNEGEKIPLNFGANRKRKESIHVINTKAHQIMREEIERAGILNSRDNQACNVDGHKSKIRKEKLQLHFPLFIDPTMASLRLAHSALKRFLPPGDCEPFHSVQVAKKYYDHFKPDNVKVILLAESHAYTDDDNISRNGPIIGYEKVPLSEYDGPRDFLALVYCLAYGEESILEKRPTEETMIMSDPLKSQGTPQFWKLFAACAGEKRDKYGSYGGKILKSNTTIEERMENKLNILQRLKKRGIWLLDTSIVAWYITQPAEYNITQKNKLIHKLEKARPPSNMKRETLVLSWELYIKHEVQKAAKEGHLKLFVPIGNTVKDLITQERFVDAITVHDREGTSCTIYNGMPAPNAWIPGKNGLDNVLEKLATVVDNVISTNCQWNQQKQVSDTSTQVLDS